MRLIDADALKEQFREGAYTIKGIREEIDNAPTVKPTITCKECDGYEAGYSAGEHDVRPQGEWIFDEEHSITMDFYKCTNCNYFCGTNHHRYCPKCGSYMRVKNELAKS